VHLYCYSKFSKKLINCMIMSIRCLPTRDVVFDKLSDSTMDEMDDKELSPTEGEKKQWN
jgi:hypothetical protein